MGSTSKAITIRSTKEKMKAKNSTATAYQARSGPGHGGDMLNA
jgi:hypothetical protein